MGVTAGPGPEQSRGLTGELVICGQLRGARGLLLSRECSRLLRARMFSFAGIQDRFIIGLRYGRKAVVAAGDDDLFLFKEPSGVRVLCSDHCGSSSFQADSYTESNDTAGCTWRNLSLRLEHAKHVPVAASIQRHPADALLADGSCRKAVPSILSRPSSQQIGQTMGPSTSRQGTCSNCSCMRP